MNKDDTAVMIVDMQENYMPPFFEKKLVEDMDSLILNQLKLLGFAKKYDLFVINLESINSGTILTDLRNNFNEKKTFTIPKYNDNSFIIVPRSLSVGLFKYSHEDNEFLGKRYKENFELINKLNSLNISNLILTGVDKKVCMLSTFRGARKRGYRCFTSDELMNFQRIFISEYDASKDHYKTLDELLHIVEYNSINHKTSKSTRHLIL